jgi:hypothetical protein
MASPTVTYTFTNATVADADEVNTNFTDIINSLTDGSKDLSISALTCAGAATLNGSVTLGNASGDDITITGSLSSTIPIKTTNSYDIGSGSLGLAGIYFGTADTDTARIVSAALAADRTYTMPDAGANANFVMSEGAATVSGVKTFDDGAVIAGTTTNDNAAAGDVGEFISATAGSDDAITGSVQNLVSISLTAGDWDVFGVAVINTGGTAITAYSVAVSKTSAGFDSTSQGGILQNERSSAAVNKTLFLPTGPRRISLASTTTVYLVFDMDGSTYPNYDSTSFIGARRRR